MTVYLRQLTFKTLGTGLATLAAMTAAARPFDVLTFEWPTALTVSASAALLALLEGLAGRFTGDPSQATITR